jgi:hypothetical protein
MDDVPKPVPNTSEDLLAGLSPLPADVTFQEALSQRTTRLVRRRWWWKRCGWTAALTACYAAGLLTMGYLLPSADPEREPPRRPAPELASSEPDPTSDSVAQEATEDNAPSPLALEWQALDSPEGMPALFRAAGDRYLEETGDVQSAVRCYRHLLEAEGGNEATVAAGDSWLLIALKEAKQREKLYANDDG